MHALAPHAKHQPPRNTLKRDSPPPPQFARHGAHTQTTNHPRRDQLEVRHPPRSYRGTRPRFASGTLMSLRRPPKPPRTRQGNPWGAATFSGSALRVSHGRSPMRSEERAERPGDGCPCVGAKETCGAHHQKQSRAPTPQALKTVFTRERKNPADSEESAGFSLKCAPWDSNPEPID